MFPELKGLEKLSKKKTKKKKIGRKKEIGKYMEGQAEISVGGVL